MGVYTEFMAITTRTLSIAGMTCDHCLAAVRRTLDSIPGVAVRDVSLGGAVVEIGDPTVTDASLAAALDEEGYRLERVDLAT